MLDALQLRVPEPKDITNTWNANNNELQACSTRVLNHQSSRSICFFIREKAAGDISALLEDKGGWKGGEGGREREEMRGRKYD
jgi:hypothetical protein